MIMKKIFLILALAVGFTACSEDWLEVEPSTSMSPDAAFTNIDDAENALNGVYNALWTRDNNATYYGADMFTFGDVKGDDVRAARPGARVAMQYNYTESPEASTWGFWNRPFVGLLNVTTLIERAGQMEDLNQDQQEQLDLILGQAYALRALFHFDLVRIYGKMPENGNPVTDLGVPVIDRIVHPSENVTRNSVEAVYAQIFDDIERAIDMLPANNPSDGTLGGWAAKALGARMYLYYKDYDRALELASDVIDNGPYELYSYEEYASVWSQDNTSESIFEIMFNAQQNSDREGLGYLWDIDGYNDLSLTNSFLTFFTEDSDDVRLQILADDPEQGENTLLRKFPGKNGESPRINNHRVIRLAEVYLIAAEAALLSNNPTLADSLIKELYDVRTNRDNEVSNVDLDRILEERRKELVGEGHRFFDLMRTGNPVVRIGDDHWTSIKVIEPDDFRAIQPVPQTEIDANPEMEQNPNYGG